MLMITNAKSWKKPNDINMNWNWFFFCYFCFSFFFYATVSCWFFFWCFLFLNFFFSSFLCIDISISRIQKEKQRKKCEWFFSVVSIHVRPFNLITRCDVISMKMLQWQEKRKENCKELPIRWYSLPYWNWMISRRRKNKKENWKKFTHRCWCALPKAIEWQGKEKKEIWSFKITTKILIRILTRLEAIHC